MLSMKSEIIPSNNKLYNTPKNPSFNKSHQSFQNTNYRTKSNSSKQMNTLSNKDVSTSKVLNTEVSKLNNKQLFEKEIIQNINDFRYKLNQELLSILTDEKNKEELREKALISCINKKERQNLEKLFGVERAQAAQKINNFNE